MGTFVLISVLILITCILLVLIVLTQNAKGGGLSSTFGGGGQQVMGVRKTTDFLEKATWSLAIILLILTLTSTFVIPRAGDREAAQSELRDRIPAQDAGPIDLSSPAPPTEMTPEPPED